MTSFVHTLKLINISIDPFSNIEGEGEAVALSPPRIEDNKPTLPKRPADNQANRPPEKRAKVISKENASFQQPSTPPSVKKILKVEGSKKKPAPPLPLPSSRPSKKQVQQQPKPRPPPPPPKKQVQRQKPIRPPPPNKQTQQQKIPPPPPENSEAKPNIQLPPGWITVFSKSQRKWYYFDKKTNRSVWEWPPP